VEEDKRLKAERGEQKDKEGEEETKRQESEKDEFGE